MSHKWVGLGEAFEHLEQRCTNVARGVITVLWRGILERTPQFSGGLVESWTYSVGAPRFVDRTTAKDEVVESPKWAGYKPNILKAELHNLNADTTFKLGDKVYLANGATYASDVNAGEVPLRAVNAPFAVERAMDVVMLRYGLGINPRQAAQLVKQRVGE